MMWDYGYAHPMMWGGYGFMGALGSLLWVILIILVIVLAIRWLRHGTPRRGAWMSSSALDILKERYAKGEMTTAEYEERKKALEA